MNRFFLNTRDKFLLQYLLIVLGLLNMLIDYQKRGSLELAVFV